MITFSRSSFGSSNIVSISISSIIDLNPLAPVFLLIACLAISLRALKEIAKQAISRKTGARGLRSIMEDILMETMFELPNDDLEKVIIDEKTVASKNDPIKLLKTKRKKTSSGN